MGGDLFPSFPGLLAEADAVLGYSLADLCRENPDNALLRTEYSQPALYVVEVLALLRHREEDPAPADFVAGHSVGEFAALFAAGVFDFATGLRLVRRRGELMSRCPPGAMAAVLGLQPPEVAGLLARLGGDDLDVALDNAPGQTALAGPVEAIDRLVGAAAEAGVKCVRLNTSGPFHSRWMSAAAEEFGRCLADVRLDPPRVPVIANATARPHRPGEIAGALVRQMTGTVQWRRSIRLLLSLAGERGDDDIEFVELGPGRTLTGMVRRIRKEHLAETLTARA
jgi:trans-AT polyketide synthase/acyltransferase/oxidoreductase domain-containing protein